MAEKCPVCGAPMENNNCGYCGYKEEISSYAATVPFQSGQSGQPQIIIQNQMIQGSEVVPGVSKKNKITALLLCIFLGWLGIHRFYVGKIGTGLLYLFTGGLFGVGWLIDIIMIAVGAFKDQFALPLR